MRLNALDKTPSFGVLLLELIAKHNDSNVRFAASLFFKNFIKRKWVAEVVDEISVQDREVIKSNIIHLMSVVPPILMNQLSETITIIANLDFPSNWSTLLHDLVSKMSLQNFTVNIGVLQTAHSIFKRWRSQVENNDLFTEIKYVMVEFSPHYLEFLRAINIELDQNNDNMPVILDSILLLLKIFYSLNCQDLPEFFEDNMEEFMGFFRKYLEYSNPRLINDSEEPGVLEKIKTTICEIIDMYASKYEADFKQLPVFVEIIWGLLTNTSSEQRFDILVSKAMSFLTAVVKHDRHKSIFEGENVLGSICIRIILPNITLRG